MGGTRPGLRPRITGWEGILFLARFLEDCLAVPVNLVADSTGATVVGGTARKYGRFVSDLSSIAHGSQSLNRYGRFRYG